MLGSTTHHPKTTTLDYDHDVTPVPHEFRPSKVIAPWHVNFTGLFLTNVYYWSTNQARDVGVPLGQPCG